MFDLFSSKTIALFLSGSILFASCSSTTSIQSNPSGAKVFINGMPVGTTPYNYSDTKIIGSTTMIRLEKEGFETINTQISRDEEVDVCAVVGGILVLVPFLWTMKYKPGHIYELVPTSWDNEKSYDKPKSKSGDFNTKADKLRELKKLLDEDIITQAEYDKEKKKILDSDED